MPSSTRKRQRTRRDAEQNDSLPSNFDLEPSSPAQPPKRRKQEQNEPQESTNDDGRIAQVTQYLKAGDNKVQASKDYANSIHESNQNGVQAFGKIAAQDWTYYITKVVVKIGRAPEKPAATSGDNDDEEGEEQVHIDLGPSKMVSRNHATIAYDAKNEVWLLRVTGRNGAKVDGQPCKRDEDLALSSGQVIEIGNVEMMFVLPTEIIPLHIHPNFVQRCAQSPSTPDAGTSQRSSLNVAHHSDRQRPGTPPASSRGLQQQFPMKSPAVSTPAPVMVGASGADLSLDENQHIKPQYSYAQMITQAILDAPGGKLNLNGIYNFITTNYSYYRHQPAGGWQNSIRHNLSLSKSFEKVPRSTNEPGKGMKWQLVPETKEDMIKNAWRVGRGGHRGSSAPSSPNQLNYVTQGPREMAAREPPSTRRRRGSPLGSPLRSSLPIAQSTPIERRGGRAATLTADGSPLPRQRKSIISEAPPSSFQPQSPTLTSSYLQDESTSFVTPAPPKVHPRLAPPSTAQRPSQCMPTSSPAPFWKYADIGNTPMKLPGPYDSSPSKSGLKRAVESSSPPPQAKSPFSSPSKPQNIGKRDRAEQSRLEEEGEEEEEEFDLTKGFQSIGSFHAPKGGADRAGAGDFKSIGSSSGPGGGTKSKSMAAGSGGKRA